MSRYHPSDVATKAGTWQNEKPFRPQARVLCRRSRPPSVFIFLTEWRPSNDLAWQTSLLGLRLTQTTVRELVCHLEAVVRISEEHFSILLPIVSPRGSESRQDVVTGRPQTCHFSKWNGEVWWSFFNGKKTTSGHPCGAFIIDTQHWE